MAENNIKKQMDRLCLMLNRLGYSYTCYSRTHSIHINDINGDGIIMSVIIPSDTDGRNIIQNGQYITEAQLEESLKQAKLFPAVAYNYLD